MTDKQWLDRELDSFAANLKRRGIDAPPNYREWSNSQLREFQYREIKATQDAHNNRTRGMSESESIADLGEFIGKHLRQASTSNRFSIPSKYQLVNIAALNGPKVPAYDNAVKSLLSLHRCPCEGKGNWTSKPFIPGGIVVLVGKRGTGKTHMASGLLNLFRLINTDSKGKQWGPSGKYCRAADLFSAIKSTFGNTDGEKQEDILRCLEESSILVIDEAQVRSGSQWENDLLVNIIDRRYSDQKPTVLISNLQPK